MVNNFAKKIMLNKLRKHIKESSDKDLYTVCTSQCFLEDFYQLKSYSYMNNLLKESKKCDSILPISKQEGRDIEELFNNKDIVVGIYTTSFKKNELQSSTINKIIHEGINVQYKTFDIPDLNGKVQFPEDFLEAMYNLKSDCKHSNIDFIITFPRVLVNETGDYREDAFKYLFNVNENGVYIKSDFVDSYVVSSQGTMTRINKPKVEKLLINKKSE